MGRKAKYRNDAERQKAYRDRKKLQQCAFDLLESTADALRNSPVWSDGAYVSLDTRRQYAQFEVRGRHRYTVNPLAVQWLLATGELEDIGGNHFRRQYRLKSD